MKTLKNYSLVLLPLASMFVLLACQVSYLLPPTAPTPTATRSRTATPTAVAKVPPSPLPTVAPVAPVAPVPPTAVPEPVTATATDNLRVRAAPSTSAAIIDRLTKGATALVVGRNATNDWWQIVLPTNASQRGWIAAEFATASGSLDSIPVVQGGAPNPPAPPGPAQPTRRPVPPPYPYP